jgi:hypothetical protein
MVEHAIRWMMIRALPAPERRLPGPLLPFANQVTAVTDLDTTDAPPPRLVAAQLMLGALASERVPWWAAMLADGHDAQRRDPRGERGDPLRHQGLGWPRSRV